MKVAPDSLQKKPEDEVSCPCLLASCVMLTADAVCCWPCCMFCGGFCGRFPACITHIPGLEDKISKPGSDTCMNVCMIQSIAGVLMPFTLCGCLWGCCGLAVPCAKGLVKCVIHVEAKNPSEQTMKR